MSARADQRLQTALAELAAVLNATGAPWMVIGGIAVIARGVRRFTADIDAAIRGDQVELGALITALAKRRIAPRIPDAQRFASENLVLLLRHIPSGADLDLSFAWTAFEHEAIRAATIEPFGAATAPMARPEDLIVFKIIANRGKDLDDVAALLALYPSLDLHRVRARVRELASLADADEAPAVLESVIAASHAVRSAGAPTPRSPVARPRARVKKPPDGGGGGRRRSRPKPRR